MLVLSIILCLVGVGLILFGFNRMGKYRLIQDTPTSKVRSMAMGIVELHGQVHAKETIKTPFSQSDCVYYRYTIEEYRRHTRRDSDGKVHTEYRWETVGSGERRIPFFARDDTGDAYVRPDGAEISVGVKKAFYQRSGLFGAIGLIIKALDSYNNNDPSGMNVTGWNLEPMDPHRMSTWGASVGDRRYYEYYLEPNENLFLIGTASPDNTAPNNVVVKKGENEKTFIISNKKEEEVLKGMMWTWLALFIIGAIVELLGVILLLFSFEVI